MTDVTEITIVENVWASCSASESEAALKKLKAQMINTIRELVISNGWNASATAKHLGLTQPRTSNLLSGQISKFSLDALYTMLYKCRVSLSMKFSDGKVVCIAEEVAA